MLRYFRRQRIVLLLLKPTMKSIRLALLLCLSTFALKAQQFSILGRVVDSATKAPLPGASAFCPNTTYGTVSNAEGLFFLKLPSGGYDLVVSYTGYDRKVIRISDNVSATDTLLFELPKQDKTMSEVAVVASNEVPDGWNKYGKFFTDNFIGTSPNATTCILKNPEALRFFYTKKRNRLKVTTKEDLIIENPTLGYTIRYQMDSFSYDYNNNISQFTGYPFYTETDTTVEVKKQYLINRARTYLGSRLHFMRSLYNSVVNEQGFIVEKLGDDPKSVEGTLVTDLYNPEEYSTDSGDVIVNWNGRFRISYKSVFPHKKYLEEYKLPPNSRYQITLLDIEGGFVVERNGYFYEQYDVVNTGYWAWKKLGETLPYDYVYQ